MDGGRLQSGLWGVGRGVAALPGVTPRAVYSALSCCIATDTYTVNTVLYVWCFLDRPQTTDQSNAHIQKRLSPSHHNNFPRPQRQLAKFSGLFLPMIN
ncbi:hypothetical protein E2C01_052640 [Portunus trituberculatus]|uniref:Uncharacterized protein n=1 Tax=Portunus trituberculatus TaxID=210409 RepID=A0A5B7GMB9_PORTR|nr:hypothetical protein [Portunus trituberculatus]